MRLPAAPFLALALATVPLAHAAALPGGDGRAAFLPMVMQEAAAQGLPPEIADAVAMVETGYTPGAVGSSGEIGLMQVMPATALQLGFHGTLAELADPATNIHLGVSYLTRAWAASGGDICRALTKYRAGLGQESTSPLSARYCARAIAWLMDGDSRLPDGAAPPTVQAQDPYVVAMLPLLPEQAGLLPAPHPMVLPVMATMPAPVLAIPREDAYQHRIGRTVPANMSAHAHRPGGFRRYLPAVQASLAQVDASP